MCFSGGVKAGADGVKPFVLLGEIVRPAEGFALEETGSVVVGPGLPERELPADVIGVPAGGLADADDEKRLPDGGGYFPRVALPVPSVTSSTSLTWEAL